MSKVLRYRLVDAPATKYGTGEFPEIVEESADVAEATQLLEITEPEAIVLWNDRLEDRYLPIYQGLGVKYLLHSNEYISITPGSVAEELYYFAVADDADLYCDTATNFALITG